MFSYILFDLDGTISDPKQGITGCVQYALRSFGIEEDADKLEPFIGPPLAESFMQFYGFTEEQAQTAVAKYRERFSVTGKFENVLYPGMAELLRDLKEAGAHLAIASSKPTVYVEDILEYFKIRQYFTFVVGSELDGRRVKKEEVVDEVLRQIKEHMGSGKAQQAAEGEPATAEGEPATAEDEPVSAERAADFSSVVMIGDRKFDIEGAKSAGLSNIGVAYGYARPGELREAGAQIIVQDVKGLRRVLLGYQAKEPETNAPAAEPIASRPALEAAEPIVNQAEAAPQGIFSGGNVRKDPRGVQAGKIARALGISLLAMVIYSVVGAVAANVVVLVGIAISSQSMDSQTYNLWLNFANAAATLAGFVVCCSIWHREINVRTTKKVDWLSVVPMVILAAALAIGMNGFLNLIELYKYSPTFQRISEMQVDVPVWLGILSYGILAPLGEEVVFRRVVYGQLRKVSSVPLAVVVSGLVFGLFHGNLVQAVYATVIGIVLAIVYELYGSILAPMLFHAVANLFVYLMLDVSPVGGVFLTAGACLFFLLTSAICLVCMVKWQKNAER